MCGKDTSPSSIFDIDCPLVMTREENEFRLAMKEKMAQAAYRGMEAEFKVPVVSARMEFDASESIGVVNVSQVKPATNEELGMKFDSTKACDADPADIPDAEHPYQDETLYFTPDGQNDEPPIDYRYRAAADSLDSQPAGSDGASQSVVTREEFNNAIEKLEFKFYELMRSVQAYDERIEDLISDVEMLKAGAESGGVHDNSIQPPSFPAGLASAPTNEPQPLNAHTRRFIAHKDTVIDTARCGEFTTSNPAFTADMPNSGKDWYSGAYRQFPKVTERHRLFNERAAVIAQESIPLCRAVEYIILGNEMYDSVSFDLNSYLKGDGKFLKPLDRAQSICIAIDWLRVELNRLRHERWREEEARIAAGRE